MSDSLIKCSNYRCTIAVSHCTTQCAYTGRNGKLCPDLAKFATEEPDQLRQIVNDVINGSTGKKISNSFKGSFPSFVPGMDTQAPPPQGQPPTVPTAPAQRATPPAAPAAPAAVPSANVGGPPSPQKPDVPPATTTAPTSKPAARVVPPAPSTTETPASPGRKERTMADTESPANPAGTSGAGAPGTDLLPARRRGGLRKGQKLGARKKSTLTAVNGMVFLIETEPGSGLFKIDNLEMADFLQLRVAGRRVIGALEAKEL